MQNPRLPRLLAPALLLLSAGASAQSFNMDVGANLILWPTPSDAYGAAAAQPGRWNAVDPITLGPIALVDLSGAPTPVTATTTTSSSYTDPFLALGGDDNAFMADCQHLSAIGSPTTWTFSGLQSGDYRVYTYAWDPAVSGAETDVSIPGQPGSTQRVGNGVWTGSPHVLGVTYALHSVTVTDGTLTVEVASAELGQSSGAAGSVNGFQLVQLDSPFAAYCFGDGQGTPCPCGNANDGSLANAQAGCANGVSSGGARLVATGDATVSSDTVVLRGDGLHPLQPGLYFQADNALNSGAGVAFGDGLRCAGGNVLRLQVVTADAQGASATSVPIAAQGGVAAGQTKRYQLWYRNPASSPCGTGFNLTNGVEIAWQ